VGEAADFGRLILRYRPATIAVDAAPSADEGGLG